MSSGRIGTKTTHPLAMGESSLKPLHKGVKIALIAQGALFIGATSTTVFFAILPVGPLLPGTSITITLFSTTVVASGTLVTSTISLVVCRKRVAKGMRYLVRRHILFKDEGVYRGSEVQPTIDQMRAHRKQPLSKKGIRDDGRNYNVNIPTRDGLVLSGVWRSSNDGKADKTIILFPSNTIGFTGMSNWAGFLHTHDFNVLTITPRGYGISEGSLIQDGELGAMLDAEAAINWLSNDKGIEPKEVIALGSCTGGAMAAILGKCYPIKAVVFDHSFKSFKGLLGSHFLIPPLDWLVSSITLPKGQLLTNYELPKGWLDPDDHFFTDGFNSAKKVKDFGDTKVIVIQGESDKKTPKHHGRALAREEDAIFMVPGGHNFGGIPGQRSGTGYQGFINHLNALYGGDDEKEEVLSSSSDSD